MLSVDLSSMRYSMEKKKHHFQGHFRIFRDEIPM